jgi:hypothetical protein
MRPRQSLEGERMTSTTTRLDLELATITPCTCDDYGHLPMREPCGCCGNRGPCSIPCTTGKPYKHNL